MNRQIVRKTSGGLKTSGFRHLGTESPLSSCQTNSSLLDLPVNLHCSLNGFRSFILFIYAQLSALCFEEIPVFSDFN